MDRKRRHLGYRMMQSILVGIRVPYCITLEYDLLEIKHNKKLSEGE